MLRNLKQIYMRQSDPKRALSCTDRILLFAPTEVEELRDRGTLYLRLECFAAALKDFERALELNPQGEAADDIRSLLPELRRRAAQYQ
jgi:regulator of sirC expression with transglutaminase-like and TPR domain